MKKVIEGTVYNTETAKKICEQSTEEIEHAKGAVVKKLKQLFKTKSRKYFFFIKNEFTAHVAINNYDIDPIFEETDLIEEKIIPISYELAFQFASEIINSNPESQKVIAKYFPKHIDDKNNGWEKIQKKIYISEKADWYLEMMCTENNDTTGSFIEKLIVNEYRRLYSKGIMQNDPYFEMNKLKNPKK